MLTLKNKFKLLGIACGIFFSFLLMALGTEKLFKSEFDGDKFDFSFAFVASQCIVFAIVAKVLQMTHNHQANETPQKFYVLIAIFCFIGMVTANMALAYVPYPIQVIGKACKPIPVMIFGVLLAGKTYKTQKYFCVSLIVMGVVLFMFKTNTKNDTWNSGALLIAISLICDGLLGATQDSMRKVSKPSSLNFMFYTNAWSSLMLLVALAVNGEGRDMIKFLTQHPEALIYHSAVLVTATSGQLFLSAMITNFGSLPLSIVTTLRKFFTVLFSVIFFRHTLELNQWIATALIFTALVLEILLGMVKSGNVATKQEEKNENLNIDI